MTFCPYCQQEMPESDACIIWCPNRPVNYDIVDSCTTITDSTTLDNEYYTYIVGHESEQRHFQG